MTPAIYCLARVRATRRRYLALARVWASAGVIADGYRLVKFQLQQIWEAR